MAVVTLDRLTKIYDRAHAPAADAVSLEVRHGEFMVLLGPSGCGKTTTLRMIAGLEFDLVGDALHRRPGCEPRSGQGPRHRHGLPVLCALPAHERSRQPGLRVAAPVGAARRDRTPGEGGGRHARALRPARSQAACAVRAGNASAWRSAGRSCATPRSFCSTSRCPTSTRRCASRPAARSASSTAGSAQP